jgi:hypothetical protein
VLTAASSVPVRRVGQREPTADCHGANRAMLNQGRRESDSAASATHELFNLGRKGQEAVGGGITPC